MVVLVLAMVVGGLHWYWILSCFSAWNINDAGHDVDDDDDEVEEEEREEKEI